MHVVSILTSQLVTAVHAVSLECRTFSLPRRGKRPSKSQSRTSAAPPRHLTLNSCRPGDIPPLMAVRLVVDLRPSADGSAPG